MLKIGIIQQHNTPDISDNRNRLMRKIRTLAADGAQLVVNQELHDSLYFCQTENVDLCSLATPIPSDVTDAYAALAKELGIVIVTSLFERRAPGLYHNTAVVFEKDGTIAGKYRKMHIPDDPAYYEKFYFTPGDLGFEPIDTSVGRLGVLVCWDQWYPEAARLMALRGAEILIYPTAIGFESSNTPTFWGSSFVAGPQGEFLYQAPADAEQTAIAEVDMQRSEAVRRWWPFLRDRRIECYGGLTRRFID